MPDRESPTDHPYRKDQFTYDEETDSYTCPHGQVLPYFGMKIDKTEKARLYRRASGTICRGYPAFGVCAKSGRYGRIIEIGQYDTALRRHRDWMATEEARQAYLRRMPLIEPLFAILRNQLERSNSHCEAWPT